MDDEVFVDDPLADTNVWDRTIELSELNNRVEDAFLTEGLNINNVLGYNVSYDTKLDIVHEPVLPPIKEELSDLRDCIDDNEDIQNKHEIKSEPVEGAQIDNRTGISDYLENDDVVVHKEIVYVNCMRTEDISGVTRSELNKLDAGILSSHCETCNEDYKWYCYKCSMLSYILDKSIIDRSEDRAKKTVPNFLMIRNTFCMGVYSLKCIPKNVKFGPFEGLDPIETTSGCAWKLKEGVLSVSPENMSRSNWMQYVQCVKLGAERNLTIFQQDGKLYFRSCRQINPGDELLVSYGDTLNAGSDDVQSYCYPVAESHMEAVYACTYCCLGFSSEVHLHKHKTVCPNTENKDLTKGCVQCAFCKIYLDMRENSEYHMRHCCVKYTWHRSVNTASELPPVQSEQSASASMETQSPPPDAARYFKCFYCDYKTKTTVEDLRKHILTHKNINKSEKPKRVMYVKTWTKGNYKEYKCSRCRFETDILYNCQRHYRHMHQESKTSTQANENTRRYKCTVCDYRTNLKNTLRRHVSHVHGKVMPYDCHDCQNGFSSKELLDIHMKDAHAKKYSCPDCHYQTNHKAQLLRHMTNVHSVLEEDEMHKCNHCGFRTKYSFNYRAHMLRQHGARLPLLPYKADGRPRKLWVDDIVTR